MTEKMRSFAMVVAAATEKLGIGVAGKLPWKCSQDLAHFRQLTMEAKAKGTQNAVIMGRKTWESLPARFRPLPDRINVILSRSPDKSRDEHTLRCVSLDEALTLLAKRSDVGDVFVIGGGQVYAEAIGHACCGTIHMTYFHFPTPPTMDTFFPDPLKYGFRLMSRSALQEEGPSLSFEYRVYSRHP